MFQIIPKEGQTTYSETLTWVKSDSKGGYTKTTWKNAEGFKAYVPVSIVNEGTGSVTPSLEERVYSLTTGGLYGIEPVAEVFGISAPLTVTQNQEIIDILTGVTE